MNVFILNVYSLEDDIKKVLPMENPIPLFSDQSNFISYFSSEEKAHECFKDSYTELDDEDKASIVYYSVSSEELDTGYLSFYKTFRPNGHIMRDSRNDENPFFGNDTPLYKKGDYILYTQNEALTVGLVIEPPPTTEEVKKSKYAQDEDSNVYFVAFANPSNPKDDYPHSHLSVEFILNKIDEAEVGKFLKKDQVYYLKSKLK